MNGKDLRELREKHNLTQQDVANSIGTRVQRISEWENGKKSISPSYQRLISMYFENLR